MCATADIKRERGQPKGYPLFFIAVGGGFWADTTFGGIYYIDTFHISYKMFYYSY